MHDTMTKKIAITVAIDIDKPFCKELPLDLDTPITIKQALDTYCQCYDVSPEQVEGETGIFGKPVAKDTLLQAGDRLEVYQPLRIDPMEARRRRAERRQQRLKNT